MIALSELRAIGEVITEENVVFFYPTTAKSTVYDVYIMFLSITYASVTVFVD